MTSRFLSKAKAGLTALALLAITTLFAGCGGSSGGSTANTPEDTSDNGEVMISLTDAEGDFLTYIVDVTELTLTHVDGTVVNVLPETTQVDFAQYVDTSELLSVTSVPKGAYESATITLDFTNAAISVQDGEGNPVIAEAVDEDGVTLTQLTVELSFKGRDAFVISRGRLSHVALDFDLDASNTIAFSETGALVTVSPVLTADTVHLHTKPTRLRGLLADVDTDNQSFTLNVRPFHKHQGHFGEAAVAVTETTRYEIDGEPVDNADGLATLNTMTNAAVVALGQWDRELRQFVATEVYAGSSVPWDDDDFINGTVVARDGYLLTLRGAMVEHHQGHLALNDQFSLTLSEETRVNRDGETVTLAEISVGSAIKASGLSGGDNSFDASSGFVRISQSRISGKIVNVEPLTLELQLINGRQPELFDFSGTGSSAENDADPVAYEIDTAGLDLSGLSTDALIKVCGYVAAFGSAPADFVASSIIDPSDVDAHLVVEYGRSGSLTAIASNTEAGLLLNLDDAERRHHIFRAATALDLKELEAVPLIVPVEGGIFSIAEGHSIDMYTSYSEFVSNLATDLEDGKAVERVDGHGLYDDAINEFSSRHTRVTLAR